MKAEIANANTPAEVIILTLEEGDKALSSDEIKHMKFGLGVSFSEIEWEGYKKGISIPINSFW